MKASELPVVVEQTFNADIITVWKAITEINQMRQWYFDNIPDFKPEVGFKTRFDITSGERTFPHVWEVTEVELPHRIAYAWRYATYPGEGLVSFELSSYDGRTTLKVTTTIRADFPDDIPEFQRESCVAGWQFFIQDRLKAYLERD